MAAITRKQRKRLRDLHARMGSSNPAEAESARHKLVELLQKLGKSWNDLPELLRDDDATSASVPPQSDPRNSGVADPFDLPGAPTPADTVRHMVESYVALGDHKSIAVALWTIHTHVYDQYMVTPRLALISPAPDCGKTTLLDVIGRLTARSKKSDNITAAAIYHYVHVLHCTLLVDEADNLDLAAKATLRAVLNAGHRRGGSIDRMIKGLPQSFGVFAPVALGSLELLTLPLMRRSIVIRLARHDGSRPLRLFNTDECGDLDLVYGHVRHWLRRVQLNRDPDMPTELRGRKADNWRPLIAIADACGPVWGELARDAAVALTRANRDEAAAITLLNHIRQIFEVRGVDRLASKLLLADLLALDEMWSEWRGVRGDEHPRKLTQGAIALLLNPFGIRPRNIWPLHRTPTDTSARGYMRSWFEQAWRAYCDGEATDDGTAAQASNIRRLRSV